MINTIKATINLTNVCLDEVDLGNGVIYRGDDLATTLEIKAPVNSNAYVLLACITPNGRNLGPFNADSTASDNTTTTYEFLLTKENGYNFAVGRTELIVYYCVVNSNSSISKKAIGSICVDVKKGVSVDDEATFIIGDTTDADAVLTDLNAKMDNLINQVATYSTQISNKLDAVKNTVTLTNTGTLFTSRVESGTDYTVQSQGRNGISSAVDSSVANNTENSTAQITTRTITDKTSSNSTETKQTANYTTIKATDGTNTKTLAITPQSVNINGKDVVVEDDLTAEATARQDADASLQNQITQLGLDLDAEEDARTLADTSLQSQIDAINAAQNLADIVADLTALNNYDTSVLEANDKVEVLSDSDHDYSATVYNWSGSAWQYIGKYGDSYSKAESDAKYVNLTGTQTISGSKTFTNNTFWAIEDSSNHRGQINAYADYLYINYYSDSSLDNYVQKTINATNLYDKSYIVDYTNGTNTRREQYSNLIVDELNFNDGSYSNLWFSNQGVYSVYKKSSSDVNYQCYGGIYNYPYFTFEGTNTSAGNPYDVNGLFQLNYDGFWAYIEDNNTENYGSLRVGKNGITLKAGNDDNSNNYASEVMDKSNITYEVAGKWDNVEYKNKVRINSDNDGIIITAEDITNATFHNLQILPDVNLKHVFKENNIVTTSTIIDTANASTELFMTDAEMDTLIGEVFN